MTIMNLVTPKAVANHELLFNKLATGKYNNSTITKGIVFYLV